MRREEGEGSRYEGVCLRMVVCSMFISAVKLKRCVVGGPSNHPMASGFLPICQCWVAGEGAPTCVEGSSCWLPGRL